MRKEKQIVTCAEMKALEKAADEAGLSYYQMMENAGTAAYRYIREQYPDARQAVIFAGKGNNAGDGFVVARLLMDADPSCDVRLVLVEGEPKTTDAITNYELVKNRLPVLDLSVVPADPSAQLAAAPSDRTASAAAPADPSDPLAAALADLGEGCILIDSIFGTGFHGEPRARSAAAIRYMEASAFPVVAIDVPSGLSGDDTGDDPVGLAVHAAHTICFHACKPIHGNQERLDYLGHLYVADIGISDALSGK